MNSTLQRPRLADLRVGQEVARRTLEITRDTLVRYAGASGDFNPIHYNDEVARSVGLDGVIAHGMLTMGRVLAVVVDWAGDPGAVLGCGARFTSPVPVPAQGAALVEVVATIGALDAEAGTARVDLQATLDGTKVLGRTRATVRLETTEGDA
ncbi:MaoC family dehydratase [Brachybacterium sp. EF45031]|uniref:MaoC family dehydratase n=1 Tax=Brachybacterium sillae TaxID=2810536 RepID=UPI00217DB677|nr:MaoC family dehydratase [Brachybacterium sillae]MCS6711080.1 MaoC family dehydratase [Brachybacterium sillae]